jgi:hypothetical protein
LQKKFIGQERLVKRKHKQEKRKEMTYGQDCPARWNGASAISGNAGTIPMEEVTPSVALPKLARAKYQLELSQR